MSLNTVSSVAAVVVVVVEDVVVVVVAVVCIAFESFFMPRCLVKVVRVA